MKIKYIFIIFTVFSLNNCGIKKERNLFRPSFEISDTTTHKIKEGQKFTFGYLEVPENRTKSTQNTIKLPVYIFKSRSKNPKPDPIIYTVGGPGYSTMGASQYMNYYKYLDDRDLILFEQRGTQYAQPNLACPEWSKAIYESNQSYFDKENTDSLFNHASLMCRNRLIKNGIGLNSYNTNEIAADIEDLKNVLKIDKYNLLTISYSTKIAQVLLRDYPNGIRSVVMDSPLPLEINYDEVSVANLISAMNLIFSDCEREINCKNTFPNLRERFNQFLRDKSKNPLTVKIKNPKNEKMETFYLEGKDLISIFTSTSTEKVSNIPFEINKILNEDLSYLQEQLVYLFQEPDNGNGQGMRLSVWCAEEHPFISQSIIEEESNKYPETKGLSPAVFSSDICNIWNVKKVNAIENSPIKSNVPVLFISGGYDNQTPPYFANNMKNNFPNSFQLIFKGWKHTPTTNWGNPCAMKCANDFFNNPKIPPKNECLTKIKIPKFKTK